MSSSCNDLLRRCPWRSRSRRLYKLCFRQLKHSWRQDLCEPPVRDTKYNPKNQIDFNSDSLAPEGLSSCLPRSGKRIETGNELGIPLILSMPFSFSVSKFKERIITSTWGKIIAVFYLSLSYIMVLWCRQHPRVERNTVREKTPAKLEPRPPYYSYLHASQMCHASCSLNGKR